MATKKEPTVISSRIILEGIEDDDADEMRGSLSEFDTMRRACTVSLSFKSEHAQAIGQESCILPLAT